MSVSKHFLKLLSRSAQQSLLVFTSILLVSCSTTSISDVRQPVRMGSWYSEDPQRLGLYIDKAVGNAAEKPIRPQNVARLCSQNSDLKKNVVAIVAPHVSYNFCGNALAQAYGTVAGRKFDRVFILGPVHQGLVTNAVVPSATRFATPFGSLPVDTETINKLLKSPVFAIDEKTHDREVSIEMELPFVRRVLGEVKIVPIIIGNCNKESADKIADALSKVVSSNDLVVVSTEFTQYGQRFDFEPFKNNVKENIEGLDKQAFSFISHLDADGLLKFQQSSGDTICGINSLYVLLKMLPPQSTVTLLDYYTSQDVKTRKRRRRDISTSYMAIAFSGTQWDQGASAAGKK
jgi:AmmeMemoRadiSam system protein B